MTHPFNVAIWSNVSHYVPWLGAVKIHNKKLDRVVILSMIVIYGNSLSLSLSTITQIKTKWRALTGYIKIQSKRVREHFLSRFEAITVLRASDTAVHVVPTNITDLVRWIYIRIKWFVFSSCLTGIRKETQPVILGGRQYIWIKIIGWRIHFVTIWGDELHNARLLAAVLVINVDFTSR